MNKMIVVYTVIFTFCSNFINAQTSEIADKESVATLDNIITTLYETVSGKKSQERTLESIKKIMSPRRKIYLL